jgi:hypothetical protein
MIRKMNCPTENRTEKIEKNMEKTCFKGIREIFIINKPEVSCLLCNLKGIQILWTIIPMKLY